MSIRFSTAQAAEAAFYKAFEQADLAAMMAVWAEDEDIVCVHPGGIRLVGIEAVRDSWRQLFSEGPQLRFKRLELRTQGDRMLSVHSLYEHITARGDPRTHLALATNVYGLTAAGWRMLMHHASPLPASAAAPATPSGTVH
jgi:ketosteroid isomerase-like protein